MNYTEINNDLNYLNSFWEETKINLNKIKNNISRDLSEQFTIPYETYGKLKIVKFSDLQVWGINSKTTTLSILANKICNMIDKGDSLNVLPLLKRIIYKPPKRLYKPSIYGKEFLGVGHFRWNYQAYTLSKEEIQFLKEYFKISG